MYSPVVHKLFLMKLVIEHFMKIKIKIAFSTETPQNYN